MILGAIFDITNVVAILLMLLLFYIAIENAEDNKSSASSSVIHLYISILASCVHLYHWKFIAIKSLDDSIILSATIMGIGVIFAVISELLIIFSISYDNETKCIKINKKYSVSKSDTENLSLAAKKINDITISNVNQTRKLLNEFKLEVKNKI